MEACRACGCSAPRRARPAARGSRPTVWLSLAVEKISFFCVGIVVLRGIITVITPPSVSTPSESGVTSSSTMSLHVAGEHAGLDRRADRDDLVRVHALVRLLAEELRRPSPARAGCASSRRRARPRRSRSASSWRRRAPCCTGSIVRSTSGRIICSSFERVSVLLQVLRPARVGREERQVDRRLLLARELDLRLLRGVLQTLDDHLVLGRRRCRCPCGTRRSASP